MSAALFRFLAIDVPPQRVTAGAPDRNDAEVVNSFNGSITAITTLAQAGVGNNARVQGLLWVPMLDGTGNATGVCPSTSTSYIPTAAANRSSDVFNSYAAIAFAPWLNAPCMSAYLTAAQRANATAFITYHIDNGTQSAEIPPLNDTVWDLGDGGAWRVRNDFPIYAIPGQIGQYFMTQLTYQGLNSTESSGLDIRVLSEVDTQSSYNLPGLWTIVLVILAVFVAALGIVSGILHLIQRRRRASLQHRIAAGEVDLVALGVRKLTVPADLLEKMPVCPYSSVAAAPEAEMTSTGTVSESIASPVLPVDEKSNEAAIATGPAGASTRGRYSQPTCAICIDDYEPDSIVRVLPCQHIFHPECVDSFLQENSSLCPLCKKSVLPKGYCPEKVTNAMVRRERLARLQAQGNTSDTTPGEDASGAVFASTSPVARMRRLFHRERASTTTSAVEMTPTTGEPLPSDAAVRLSASERPPDCSRREWARMRAQQMVGERPTAVEEQDHVQQSRLPRWRKAVGRVFPS